MANCPICNNQIPNNQMVCPYCETIINKPVRKKNSKISLIMNHKIHLIIVLAAVVVGMLVSRFVLGDGALGLMFISLGLINGGFGLKKGGAKKALLIVLFNTVFLALGGKLADDICNTFLGFTIALGIISMIGTLFTIFLIEMKPKNSRVSGIRKSEIEKIEALKQYKNLYDNGVITEQEFTAKKKQILEI